MVRSLACASVLVALVAGCGGGDSYKDDDDKDVAAKTVMTGTVTTGQTLTVDYDPSKYAAKGLPYLGIALDANAAKSVTVGGDFPGLPHLLLVDSSYGVLAEADGVRTADGAKATLSLLGRLGPGTMLLVQDPNWAVGMTFAVSAE